MKTLANHSDRQALEQRMNMLRPDQPRCWGKMSAHQMVCHFADSFRGAMGEKAMTMKPGTFGRDEVDRAVFARAVAARREDYAGDGSTDRRDAASAFEDDREAVRLLLDRFAREPRDFAWRKHPIFLVMRDADWMRWGYLHMDHHFRQFGA